jgi:hypothetical protein
MPLIELNRVFVVEHGSKLDLNKMDICKASADEAVVFVGRSGERNGFVAFVKQLADPPPFSAGLITVALGGSALSSFVQSQPFYTAQNIDVLTPRAEMSLDVKLYYCMCIEANRFRYTTFGREANRTLKTLMVPTASRGYDRSGPCSPPLRSWLRRSETRPVRRSRSRPPEGRSFYAFVTSDTTPDPFRTCS